MFYVGSLLKLELVFGNFFYTIQVWSLPKVVYLGKLQALPANTRQG
jgi:hypothetical protein